MKRILQSYGVLILSLIALFGSGVFVGRMTSPARYPTVPQGVSAPADADAWVAAASRGLLKDLKLNGGQLETVHRHLEPVAEAIFTDQERALFQMHLRLLEFHDSLAKTGSLDDSQQTRLGLSRAKLKELIIHKFPNMVRKNPELVIGENPEKP